MMLVHCTSEPCWERFRTGEGPWAGPPLGSVPLGSSFTTRTVGALQIFTGLAGAVQLRLRVAAGLPALQRCSPDSESGHSTGQHRGGPPVWRKSACGKVSSAEKQTYRISLETGAPGVSRTRDPLLRRQMLYPTELRAQCEPPTAFGCWHFVSHTLRQTGE